MGSAHSKVLIWNLTHHIWVVFVQLLLAQSRQLFRHDPAYNGQDWTMFGSIVKGCGIMVNNGDLDWKNEFD